MRFSRSGDSNSDLHIGFKESTDKIIVKNYFMSIADTSINSMEKIQIDNEEIKLSDFLIFADVNGDELSDDSNDKYFVGSNKNDVFNVSSGNDVIVTNSGDDTIIFEAGFDQDIIRLPMSDLTGSKTISFKDVHSRPTLRRYKNTNDLVIHFTDENIVTVEDFFNMDESSIVNFDFKYRFTNEQYSLKDIKSAFESNNTDRPFITLEQLADQEMHFNIMGTSTSEIIRGTDNNDVIHGHDGKDDLIGYDGDDIIYGGEQGDFINGGSGTDHLYGEEGKDTYYLTSGFEKAIINETGTSTDEVNTIRLEGYRKSDADYERTGNSRTVKLGSDTLIIEDYFEHNGKKYELIFDDTKSRESIPESDNDSNPISIPNGEVKPPPTPSKLHTVNGSIWRDINNDGIMSSSDVGIRDEEVRLFSNGNQIRSHTTDSYGHFKFSNLEIGVYTIEACGKTVQIEVKEETSHSNVSIRVGVDGTINEPTYISGDYDQVVSPGSKKNDRSEENDIYDRAERTRRRRDPLVFDLDGDGIETTSVYKGTYFDMDNDGFKQKTAWISNDDGFLVRDINDDGLINDGSELFGDATTKLDGTIATGGI